MSQLVASSKNLTARVKNVIKMLSKLDENQFRHFICVMNPDWLAEMANILGTDQEAENLYNAVRNSVTTYETESELESEAA